LHSRICGGSTRHLCQKCERDRLAIKKAERDAREAKRRAEEIAREAKRRADEIASTARQVRGHETARLRELIVPSLDELRSLTPQRFEDQVAQMFERLGYDVEQTPYSNDHGRDAILIKYGEKFLVECKRYGESHQSGRPDLQKFHSAIVSDKAKKGFFVTSGGFSSEARAFAATVPIDMIDGQKQGKCRPRRHLLVRLREMWRCRSTPAARP
jgi:restriction endonuclease Mrr